MKRKELTIGYQSNNLEVIKQLEPKRIGASIVNYYLCKCLINGINCNEYRELSSRDLSRSGFNGCGGNTCSNKFINLLEQRFGKLMVVGFAGIYEASGRKGLGNTSHWECLCDCGLGYIVSGDLLLSGKVQSCGCLKPNYTIGQITGHYFNRMRSLAFRRSIEFNLTIYDVWKKFEEQDGKCALTGIELTIKTKKKSGDASLDRIDSNKEYTPDNIQWVHKNVNMMKWTMTKEELIDWCNLIINYKGK